MAEDFFFDFRRSPRSRSICGHRPLRPAAVSLSWASPVSDVPAAGRQELREKLRARRRALTPSRRIQGAQALAGRLLALPFAPSEGLVAGYWATDGEIALHAWQVQLPDRCTYCLPVLRDDGCLGFAPWRPGEALRSNRFGIPEPDVGPDTLVLAADMSLVVVPLVAFDPRGNRLGMGGGWYDRSFAFRQHQPAPPWLVGAGFAEQCVDSIEPAHWDVPLDAVCSDAIAFDCRPPAT
ncbi:MAG: 5-formyltetrahydrofolate cyclo-ligase, partial [Lysobacter sp.]|nr:5-formyltetrahydrofolate cyclo-ligase [Lysobacter sp.]